MIAVLAEQVRWEVKQVLRAYEDAYVSRPQRAEALSRLADYHLKKRRFAQARDCALAACAMPPSIDTLWVDHSASGWRPRDDLAQALLGLGDMDRSIEACRQMLADPLLPASEVVRIERNLAKLAEMNADGGRTNV